MPATDIFKFIVLFAVWNGLVFAVYFVDKQAARYGRWRTSEKTLLMLAFLGGSPGAVCAQKLLRHKTRKEPFRSNLRAIAILHLSIIILTMAGLLAVGLGLVPDFVSPLLRAA